MNPRIHLFLFNTKPRVELDGQEIHIPETSLDLLIYLAVENQPIHDREKLIQCLYETSADRDRLRQVALGNLDREIKRICIRSSAPSVVGYDGSQVAVDVHEFATLITPIHGNIPLTTYPQIYPQLLEAYELYNHPFLEGYLPASYGLNSWIRAKRTAFQGMFHGLLEKLVQYEILNMRYEQAWMHAERWHQNLSDASLPLQYLIWLAINTDAYGQALSYLSRLEALSSSDKRVIGYSVEEWRRLFSRGIKPDIQALKLNRDARVEVAELINLASQNLIGRDQALEAIFETLFVRHEQRLLTITGARGIGKTVLAEAVADACLQTGLVKQVIQIGVTAETNFDRVLDAIALRTNKPYLVELDYRNKYVSIEQILEIETSLLILDQQEAGTRFSGEFRDRVKALSERATIIVCSYEAWNSVYDVALQPLDSRAASNLYNINTSDKLESESDTETLLTLTEGVPLALKLFRQARDSSKLTFHEAIAQIGRIEADDRHDQVISRHERILEWCWTLLDEPSRRILASLIDFDLLEGADADWLHALHSDLPPRVIEKTLRQLEIRGLIETRSAANGATTYHWHSLVGEFLSSIDALAHTGAVPDFKAHIQGRFCQLHFAYATEFADDYSRLDLRQRTLLHAFDLGFDRGMITLAQVNEFLPYLLARGLYDSARRIINRTAEGLADHSAGTVELLLNSAKLDSKQGEFDAADRQINEALALGDELGNTSYHDELYNQLGIIVKNRGQFEQARQIHSRALEYARENQNTRLMAANLANLGVTGIERGDFEAASTYISESLAAAQAEQQYRIIEFDYTALASIAAEQLDFEEALGNLAKARMAVQQIGSPERQAYINLNTGAIYYNVGRYTDAETSLKNGLEIAQRLQHEELIVNLRRNLARVAAVTGHLGEAEHDYKQVLIAASNRNLKWLAADVLLDLGKLSLQQHAEVYAKRCFRDALSQALELCNYSFVAEALYGLVITAAAERWIIGTNDVAATIQTISDAGDAELVAQFRELPIQLEHLRRAEFFFQRGLPNFPEIEGYRVVEALAALLGIDQES